MKLTRAEIAALEMIERGSILTTAICDKTNTHHVFGNVNPGIGVFKKLEKKGLLFFTEEDPMPDGFVFTNEVYITDQGLQALKDNQEKAA